MSNVVRLVANNTRSAHNACTDCKHFHPDVNVWGHDGWKLFGFGPGRKPTASAMQFAICSAAGGRYARIERAHNCKGQLWEPSTPQPNVDEGDGK